MKMGYTFKYLLTLLFRCDIEQEVNGLYTYDRKEKVPTDKVKAIMDAAKDYYHGHLNVADKGMAKKLEEYKDMVHRDLI